MAYDNEAYAEMKRLEGVLFHLDKIPEKLEFLMTMIGHAERYLREKGSSFHHDNQDFIQWIKSYLSGSSGELGLRLGCVNNLKDMIKQKISLLNAHLREVGDPRATRIEAETK